MVPKEFWWAEGHEALEQDWKSGDFETTIDRQHHARALGVSIGLNGVLDMLDFEQRALVARSLSVAGNSAWVTAKEARQIAYGTYGVNPMQSGDAIVAAAGLGFIAGRAVLGQGSTGARDEIDWSWQEREWDIPQWFWTNFSIAGSSSFDWVTGRFSGNGYSPTKLTSITLSGVYFLRASLAALASEPTAPDDQSTVAPKRGRKQEYDWEAATARVWGQIFRGELIPENQADVEKAFQRALSVGDKEPGESTVRPYANRVWEEFKK